MTLRPRFKRGWLTLDDLELAQLYAEGRSFVFMAARLRRSIDAVKWRIGYLKLKRADVERASGCESKTERGRESRR
jgi:hypothetical protein